MSTEGKTFYELQLTALADARKSAGSTRYEWPWIVALALSLAWAVPGVAVYAAYTARGVVYALAVAVALLTFPVFVSLWAVALVRLELERMSTQRAGLRVLEPPTSSGDESPEPEPAPAALAPGLLINGVMCSPDKALTAEAAELRDLCLRFVRAGNRRGGWSRSRIAEGEGKLLTGKEWDTASKELQRLDYFGAGPGGLAPARDVADILQRLEAAR